jgi:hypothetical protein
MARIRLVEPADSAQWLALRAALWPDENAAGLIGFAECRAAPMRMVAPPVRWGTWRDGTSGPSIGAGAWAAR